MNSVVRLTLNPAADQVKRLTELQHTFADVCNALSPLVQQTRCWNRVALHHMAYKQLRQQFPGLGSQMVCNAIYSVSRSCRIVYQHPTSPFNVARLGDRPLPRLQFVPQSPVYFDRHTLSIKNGQASMFTLDGRMKFQLDLSAADEQRFRDEKLREIVLASKGGRFTLSFFFATPSGIDTEADAPADSDNPAELPEYVLVIEDAPATLPPPVLRAQPAPLSP